MSILSDLKSLFLPPVCPVCGGPLAEGDGAFCMVCRTTVPRTMFWLKAENPMAARLRDFFPVVQASAFILFIQGSPWQRAIHDFKYRSRWRTAYELGRWFGSNLARSGLYAGVDCVVPVPLAFEKRIEQNGVEPLLFYFANYTRNKARIRSRGSAVRYFIRSLTLLGLLRVFA